jgi:hypothetical protein
MRLTNRDVGRLPDETRERLLELAAGRRAS